MNYNYKWNLSDTQFTKDKGKVFSCFSCGGGSTMGYKLAGFDVIGFNEIDPKMAEMYIINHNPKYQFIEGIQTFKDRDDLPEELFDLDILDGSPPCSSFSMAGNREDDWGKKKVFREGQKEQVLDTLFFDFIDLTNKLQPKVVIAENVTGMLIGKAKEYVGGILKGFRKAGYHVNYYVVDGSTLGLPQKRRRVFFVGVRNDIYKEGDNIFDDVLDLNFNVKKVPYSEIKEIIESPTDISPCYQKYWDLTSPGKFLDEHHPNGSFFTKFKASDTEVLPTLTAHQDIMCSTQRRYLSPTEIKLASSFPLDYNFLSNDAYYVCGMSVPPIMIANIIDRVYDKYLKSEKGSTV